MSDLPKAKLGVTDNREIVIDSKSKKANPKKISQEQI
jgi:hypothetical protein